MESLHFTNTTRSLPGLNGPEIFIEHGTRQEVSRGSLLYAAGEQAAAAYLVEQGEVRMFRYTADGRELTIEHIGEGGVFGDLEILAGAPRESQAQARTPLVVHQLTGTALLGWMDADPRFGGWLTRMLGARQVRLACRLETLLFKSANGKVAQVLLDLMASHGREHHAGILIDYPITHQEIGNLIATTRETVSYAFMDFRAQGIVTTDRRKTVITDLPALETIAEA